MDEGWGRAVTIPGTRGPGEPRGCSKPSPASASGSRESPRAARLGFGKAAREGWRCWQPGLVTEGNFAARGKTELLKKHKKRKKENLEKKGNRKKRNQLRALHLFNYALPGLSSKSAGSQEAKSHLFHYFNRHKTANETKSKLKKKRLCSFHQPVLLLMSIVSLKYVYLQLFFFKIFSMLAVT